MNKKDYPKPILLHYFFKESHLSYIMPSKIIPIYKYIKVYELMPDNFVHFIIE